MSSTHPAPPLARSAWPAVRRWSTEAVAPEQRLDYWVGAICEGFLEMDASSPVRQAFEGVLESAPLAGIGVNRVLTSAQRVVRSRRAIARSRENYYYLLRHAEHAWTGGQDAGCTRLLAGDLLLIDSRRCYEFRFNDWSHLVSLELPIDWVERWLPRPEAWIGRRIDGQAGWGHVLSHLVAQWTPEFAAQPPLPPALLADQLGALLALSTDPTSGPPTPQATAAPPLAALVHDALRERHAQPGLTALDVAVQLGVSERSLHRHLAAQGTPFASLLAACRMEAAGRLLADRRFDRLSIAEVGSRVGLVDASHFVRQCRRYLGATPGALRRRR